MSGFLPWYWDKLQKYGIYDEIEGYIGIKDNAPENIKKAFEEDMAKEKKICEEAENEGYLIS